MDLALTSWALALVIGYLLVKGLMVVTRSTSYARTVDKIPGPPTLPLLGNAWDFWVPEEDNFKILVNLIKKCEGSLVRIWLGPIALVFAKKPSSIEAMLSSSKHITKSDDYSYFHSWLGMGLLTSTGEKWQKRRKLLTPSFHFRILDDFVPIFSEQSKIFVEILREKAKSGLKFDLHPFVTRCTLDIICETAMGRHVNAQREVDSDYVKAVSGMATIAIMRTLRIWLKPSFSFNLTSYRRNEKAHLKTLHSFSRKVIKERRRNLQETKAARKAEEAKEEAVFGAKKRLAFLDTLLQASSEDAEGLTDEDIREEVDTFMFEGHDTLSSGISFALYLLGRHPEIQQKVQDEVDRVLGRGSERAITSIDIAQLKYTEAMFKEALRLYPSVPFFGRRLREDFIIDGKMVPAGTPVYVGSYLVHHDPEVFPDPEKFDPDRFLSSSDIRRHPFAFVPFSAGPRNCIGQKFAMMEAKLVLADFLRHFDVVSHDVPQDVKLVLAAIIHPHNGIWLSLKERSFD